MNSSGVLPDRSRVLRDRLPRGWWFPAIAARPRAAPGERNDVTDETELSGVEEHFACGAIRAKLLRAVAPAIELLDREARGERVFNEDLQLRACAALARLGPALLRMPQVEPPTS